MVMAAVVLYLALALTNIRYPGLNYDECLFVNAALGAPDNDSFLITRVLGIPIMVMPYIGALKAWLMAPVFAAFGVSALTLRIVGILLSACSLPVAFLVLTRLMPPFAAAATTLLLSCDPAFVTISREDFGPIAFMILLKLGAIYCFLRSIQTNSWRFFSLGLVCMAIGMFDKLNFLWFVVALVPASFVYIRPLLSLFRSHRIATALCSTIFTATIAFFYFALIAPLVHAKSRPHFEFISRFGFIAPSCSETLNGHAFSAMVFAEPTPAVCGFVPLWLLPLAVAVSCLVYLARVVSERKLQALTKEFGGVLFFSILWLTILFQIFITPEAGGPHHFMVLWPFHYFVVALSFITVLNAVPLSAKRFLRPALLMATTAWTLNNGIATYQILSDLKSHELKVIWSDRIYNLAQFITAHHSEFARIICADWGIHTQLYALSDPETRRMCFDYWRPCKNATTGSPAALQLTEILRNGKTLTVMHGKTATVFPNARSHFFDLTKSEKLTCEHVSNIVDKEGTTVYELYLVQKPTVSSQSDP